MSSELLGTFHRLVWRGPSEHLKFYIIFFTNIAGERIEWPTG